MPQRKAHSSCRPIRSIAKGRSRGRTIQRQNHDAFHLGVHRRAPPGPGSASGLTAARGSEIQPGGGNVICDFSGAMQSVPAGKFVEIGVARDPLNNNCMHLVRYIGKVSPPFRQCPRCRPLSGRASPL